MCLQYCVSVDTDNNIPSFLGDDVRRIPLKVSRINIISDCQNIRRLDSWTVPNTLTSGRQFAAGVLAFGCTTLTRSISLSLKLYPHRENRRIAGQVLNIKWVARLPAKVPIRSVFRTTSLVLDTTGSPNTGRVTVLKDVTVRAIPQLRHSKIFVDLIRPRDHRSFTCIHCR
jgi:hypothetical protein